MVNKRGFLRIVEASISIVLVASVLFFIFAQTRESYSEDLTQLGRDILLEVAANEEIRKNITALNGEEGEIEEVENQIEIFVNSTFIPKTLDYSIRICEVDDVCGNENYIDADVFASERIISSTLEDFSPKKIKIFLWRK